MDWSSVFEDEGEENGDWTRGYDPSPRTGILELLSMQGKYGPMICYAFTVNYILGVGCLGIPYAFLQSGILLGVLLVIFLSFISYVTVLWVAAATQQEMSISIYRATTNPFIISPETTLAKRKHFLNKKTKKDNKKPSSKNLVGDEETAFDESSSLLTGSTSFRNLYSSFSSSILQLVHQNPTESSEKKLSDAQSIDKSDQLLMIAIEKETNNSSAPSSARRKPSNKERNAASAPNQDEIAHRMKELEVTDLVEEFLGPWGKLTYQLSLMALTYVGLLAYTQVFNDTFRSQLYATAPTYLPPLLFGIVVIPLSCFDLSEQVVAQVIMSLLRFISLGILLIGTIIALWTDWRHSLLYESISASSSSSSHSSSSSLGSTSTSAIFYMNLQGFGVMFTTAIFSQLFQHSVPGLIRPLKEEHKKYIPKIFSAALLTTSIIYILSGTCCVLYFGRHLQQSVNLNFVDFTWGLETQSSSSVLAMITGLAMTVVLFPALDTLSVFPLIAITLGNNLHAALPQFDEQIAQLLAPVMKLVGDSSSSSSSVLNGSASSSSSPAQEKKEKKKWITLFWRLTAAIPPVIFSVVITNLVVSLQIAGLCGIVVALVTPALLHQQTQYRIELIPPSMKATMPFPDSFNNSLYVNLVLGIAVVAALISVGQMIW